MFADLQARQDLLNVAAENRILALQRLEMRRRRGEEIDGALGQRIKHLEDQARITQDRLGDLEADLGATQEALSFLVSHLQRQVDDLGEDTLDLRDDATKAASERTRMEALLWKFSGRLFALEHPEYAAAGRFGERRSGVDRRALGLLNPCLQHRREGQRRRVDRLT